MYKTDVLKAMEAIDCCRASFWFVEALPVQTLHDILIALPFSRDYWLTDLAVLIDEYNGMDEGLAATVRVLRQEFQRESGRLYREHVSDVSYQTGKNITDEAWAIYSQALDAAWAAFKVRCWNLLGAIFEKHLQEILDEHA